jgi:hypothetical protein
MMNNVTFYIVFSRGTHKFIISWDGICHERLMDHLVRSLFGVLPRGGIFSVFVSFMLLRKKYIMACDRLLERELGLDMMTDQSQDHRL